VQQCSSIFDPLCYLTFDLTACLVCFFLLFLPAHGILRINHHSMLFNLCKIDFHYEQTREAQLHSILNYFLHFLLSSFKHTFLLLQAHLLSSFKHTFDHVLTSTTYKQNPPFTYSPCCQPFAAQEQPLQQQPLQLLSPTTALVLPP